MLLQTTSSDFTQIIQTSLATIEQITDVIVGEELQIYAPPRNNVLELHFDCLRKDEIVFLRLAGDTLHITGIGQYAEIAEFVVCKFIEEKISEYEWIQDHDVVLDHVVGVDNALAFAQICFQECDSVALDKICQKGVRP